MSINAWAQVAILLIFIRMLTRCGCCKLFVTGCILGRAPRTKETLPDFREWCQVTRHPRVLRGLTGCQRDTPVLGRHKKYEEQTQKIVDS